MTEPYVLTLHDVTITVEPGKGDTLTYRAERGKPSAVEAHFPELRLELDNPADLNVQYAGPITFVRNVPESDTYSALRMLQGSYAEALLAVGELRDRLAEVERARRVEGQEADEMIADLASKLDQAQIDVGWQAELLRQDAEQNGALLDERDHLRNILGPLFDASAEYLRRAQDLQRQLAAGPRQTHDTPLPLDFTGQPVGDDDEQGAIGLNGECPCC